MGHVDKDTSGCWLWTGARSNAGYGVVKLGKVGDIGLVHRATYELLVGPIPEGHALHHECAKKLCCNPVHVVPMLKADHHAMHMVDEAARERSVVGGRLGAMRRWHPELL